MPLSLNTPERDVFDELPTNVVTQTSIRGLRRIARGKVRDIYAVDNDTLLIVATDRLSAYDVVLPDAIPGKGAILTALSNFWFAYLDGIVADHRTARTIADVVADRDTVDLVESRAVVVRRVQPLPVEAVVRGYLIGSGWKDYLASGTVCGHRLPAGLELGARLPSALFTPATKAAAGDHDENITRERVAELIGDHLANEVERVSLELYAAISDHAAARGIIVADTKFEFGLDEAGTLVLIDEVATPDSSRFWEAQSYCVGTSPASFDKQYVRDYLETLDWDKRPPGPALPPEVIARTRARYLEALERLATR